MSPLIKVWRKQVAVIIQVCRSPTFYMSIGKEHVGPFEMPYGNGAIAGGINNKPLPRPIGSMTTVGNKREVKANGITIYSGQAARLLAERLGPFHRCFCSLHYFLQAEEQSGP